MLLGFLRRSKQGNRVPRNDNPVPAPRLDYGANDKIVESCFGQIGAAACSNLVNDIDLDHRLWRLPDRRPVTQRSELAQVPHERLSLHFQVLPEQRTAVPIEHKTSRVEEAEVQHNKIVDWLDQEPVEHHRSPVPTFGELNSRGCRLWRHGSFQKS